MLQFIVFMFTYGIMVFIWSFVYLNRSDDKINQAFLAFLSVILLWMVLSIANGYEDNSVFGLILKTIYWYSMLNMSLFFLLFVYRFVKKTLDPIFYVLSVVNVLTIFARYLFPMDYSDPTFWRLSDPVVAPLMSVTFSVPAVYALYLVIRYYFITKDSKLRVQLRYLFYGIWFALVISVISEYVLPTLLHINLELSLMYFALLVFVIFVFISIMKHRLLNMQFEYIYRKLLLTSNDGIVIVSKNNKVVCINDVAKKFFHSKDINAGDKITDIIKEYRFETDYKQYEIKIGEDKNERYLSVTQYPIEPEDQDSAKLMTISDITSIKLRTIQEKEMLIEKSSLDPLTGLYNKHYLYDHYYTERQELVKDQPLVLLFIDIDDFKAINDQYGHLTGDKVLQAVAQCIKKNIDERTKVFRFGGDEFIVIFEETGPDDVYNIAEKIRISINSLAFLKSDSSISLSIGLVKGLGPLNDLITKADMAMYQSKLSGKNKTTVYTGKTVNTSPHRSIVE